MATAIFGSRRVIPTDRYDLFDTYALLIYNKSYLQYTLLIEETVCIKIRIRKE